MMARIKRILDNLKKKLFSPPVFAEDEDKTRDAALLYIILWTGLGVILAASPVLVLNNETWPAMLSSLAVVLAFALPMVWLLVIARRGQVRRASIWLPVLIIIVVGGGEIVFGGLRSTLSLGYLLSIFIAGLLMGRRAAVLFGVIASLSAGGVFLLEQYQIEFFRGVTVPLYGRYALAGWDDWFVFLALTTAMVVIVFLTRRSLVNALSRAQQNEQALADTNRQLRARGEELRDRSRDLQRRSEQLQTVADISRDIASRREVRALLSASVEQILEQFGMDYVALYLVDEEQTVAVLRASASRREDPPLPAGYLLDLTESDAVELAISTGFYQLARNVVTTTLSAAADSEDAEPDTEQEMDRTSLLPGTRSQVVLPLAFGGHVIGALDIQSRQIGAFEEDDAVVLQTLADQLAAAIENTRLLEEMQQTVRELEIASGRYTRESWQAATRRADRRGFRYRQLGVEPVGDQPSVARQAWLEGRRVVDRTDDGDGSALAVPVKLRDEVVGVLNLSFAGQVPSPDTVSLVEEVADRLALALENARLLDETRQRAQRDRLSGDISARVRASMSLEGVLQTAVRELGAALGADRSFIRLTVGQPDAQQERDAMSGEAEAPVEEAEGAERVSDDGQITGKDEQG